MTTPVAVNAPVSIAKVVSLERRPSVDDITPRALMSRTNMEIAIIKSQSTDRRSHPATEAKSAFPFSCGMAINTPAATAMMN